MELLLAYINQTSSTLKNGLWKLFPSLEFSIWERKILLLFIDSLILVASLFIYYKIANSDLTVSNFLTQNSSGILYGLILFGILSNIFNLYNLEFVKTTRKILPLVFFIGILFSIIFIFTPIITPSLPGKRLIIIGFVFFFTAALALWRLFYVYIIHTPTFFKNLVVLVSDDYNKDFLSGMRQRIEGNGNYGYRIQHFLSIPKETENKETFANKFDKIITSNKIDTIIILDKNHKNISAGLNKVLIKSIQRGINVQTYLKLYEELLEAIPLKLAIREFYSIFPISRSNANYFYKLWHRVVDIVSAVFGLCITMLLIPIIAVINLFVNKGPLFYAQLRVGKGGKEYKMTKFRSMVVDAERQGAIMSAKGDARITKFGKILRKTRIDELPQFLAVLKGDMSLIGPRPERKVFVDQLSEEIPFYIARHLVRPGITGWAQVKYPYGENLEDSYNKLEYDLYYIKNRSVTIDIRIIIKTINTVIFSKGQ